MGYYTQCKMAGIKDMGFMFEYRNKINRDLE